MSMDACHEMEALLASTQPEKIRQGLECVKREIAGLGPEAAAELFEAISAIFYIDPLDRPDLVPLLDEAINIVAGLGQWVIPALVDKLDAGDLKAQMAIAQVLGRMGAVAIEPLITHYRATTEPARHAFILYALGKIKSPEIVQAAPLALQAARSSDLELRDTATRAIGKLAESIPPERLAEETRRGFIDRLQNNLADPNAGIRAKSIRSLGKLAKYGHLSAQEKEKLGATCHRLLGTDDNYEWDRSYIVRVQAQETLGYV